MLRKGAIPVDQGWAWVVCVACMVETFVITGLFKSYGLFFVEFGSVFMVNSSTLSLMLSVQSISGSITAYLVLTVGELCFSNRTFIMFGAVVSSLSFLLTAFAPSISVVMFSQGVLLGFSIAFINGPAVVMIGKYFEKRRGFANSMLKVGGDLGSLSLAPFYRYLLDELGLRGTLIIVAGILLHIVPCGAVARPPEFYKRSKRSEVIGDQSDSVKSGLLAKERLKDAYDLHSTNIVNKKQLKFKALKNTPVVDSVKIENGTLKHEIRYLPEQTIHIKSLSNDSNSQNGTTELTIEIKPVHHLSYDRLFPKKDIIKLMRTLSEDPDKVHGHLHEQDGQSSLSSTVVNALSKSSVALYGSVGTEYGSVGNIQTENPDTDDNEIDSETSNTCFKTKNISWSKVLSKILAFRLLKNKLFMILVPSGMLSIVGFSLILTYIPPHAKDLGIDDKNSALLVSIVSGTGLAGKFITAFIADNKRIVSKRHLVLVIPMFIAGTVCHLVPVMTEFWSLAIFSAIYGFSSGFYFATFAVVIIDFVGIKNLSSALGIMVLSNGIAKAAATPLLGYLRDTSGSYMSGFHFMGTCFLVGGIILMLEPIARKWEERSTNETDPEDV